MVKFIINYGSPAYAKKIAGKGCKFISAEDIIKANKKFQEDIKIVCKETAKIKELHEITGDMIATSKAIIIQYKVDADGEEREKLKTAIAGNKSIVYSLRGKDLTWLINEIIPNIPKTYEMIIVWHVISESQAIANAIASAKEGFVTSAEEVHSTIDASDHNFALLYENYPSAEIHVIVGGKMIFHRSAGGAVKYTPDPVQKKDGIFNYLSERAEKSGGVEVRSDYTIAICIICVIAVYLIYCGWNWGFASKSGLSLTQSAASSIFA